MGLASAAIVCLVAVCVFLQRSRIAVVLTKLLKSKHEQSRTASSPPTAALTPVELTRTTATTDGRTTANGRMSVELTRTTATTNGSYEAEQAVNRFSGCVRLLPAAEVSKSDGSLCDSEYSRCSRSCEVRNIASVTVELVCQRHSWKQVS